MRRMRAGLLLLAGAWFFSAGILPGAADEGQGATKAARSKAAPDRRAAPPARARADRKGRFPTAPPPQWDEAILELFFADAREKLGPGGPGLTTSSPEAAAADSGPADSAAAATAAANAFGWSKLVSATTIEDAIKNLVAGSAEVTRSPSGFKGGGNKQARQNYSVAAMLFGVIAQYDGDVRWKKDALGLRSLYARAAANCKVGTDNSYKEAKMRSDDLAELVTGGKVELPKADAEAKWAEVVNRPPLMARMGAEGYSQPLKAWTADRGEFSKNRAGLVKEAELVAVIARVIQDPSFEYGDDETYLEYARELEQQAREIVEAVKADSLQRAQAAAGRLNQACNTCHDGYRGG